MQNLSIDPEVASGVFAGAFTRDWANRGPILEAEEEGGGISHNEAEFTSKEQCAAGAQVLLQAVLEYDRGLAEHRTPKYSIKCLRVALRSNEKTCPVDRSGLYFGPCTRHIAAILHLVSDGSPPRYSPP